MSLRSAHIIPLKNSNREVGAKWHKLIGCQTDKKQSHPELCLSLAVRDHLLNEAGPSSSEDQMPYISEEDAGTGEEIVTSSIPVVYLDDGYIQIGNDIDALGTFSLNLLVEEVVNLDALLPEILVFRQNKENYYLSFRVLGVTIRTKPFRRELHNSIVLNEKVVVKLLSDENSLSEFFKTQNITINFWCGQDKLGTTDIELSNAFLLKESKCFFKFPSPNGIVPYGSSEKSPFISIQTWLEHCLDEFPIEKEDERPKVKTVFSNVPKLPSCSGDQISDSYILDKLEKTDIKAQTDTELPSKENIGRPFVTKSVDTVIKNMSPLSPRNISPTGVYKKYVLEVSLKSLIWKKLPKDAKIIFKFLHPKAASYMTIFIEVGNEEPEEPIKLENLNVKLVYISTEDKAVNLLNSWPPKLVLTDEKDKCLSEEYEFATTASYNNFYSEEDAVLKAARTSEPLAKLNVALLWNDFPVDECDGKSDFILFPVILDEIISVKEISDIEKWKAKERNKFNEELERAKEKELNKSQEGRELKRVELEEQLIKSVNKCRQLQENLQNKVNSFKIEKKLGKRRNNNVILFEEIFRENWKKYGAENNKELVELLSKAQRDNEHLKEMIIEQHQRIRTVEKSTLTKAQTVNLLRELKVLEEKFEEAQNAKWYFKEQWKRACDEIHDMKREDILNMRNQIQQNREELSQLSLEKFTGSLNDPTENFSPSPVTSGRSSGLFF